MTFQKTEQKTTFTQPILNRILKAYNTSYHSVIDMSPTEAKKPENKADVLKANEKQVSVGMKTIQKDDVAKGDQLRVSLCKGNDKNTKQFRTNWSEELFFIKKVIRGKDLKPIQYKVEDADGQSARMSRPVPPACAAAIQPTQQQVVPTHFVERCVIRDHG